MARHLLALAVVVCWLVPAHGQMLTPEEKKEGFISLFNGKDFTNWRFGPGSALGKLPANWSVADGLIKLSGGGSPHLASQWDYDDFEARLEWRAVKANYNSGFYVRSGRNVGANQINLAKGDEGHLMGGAKGGVKVPQLQKPFGEWNEWKVLAVGDKLTFWANGKEGWKVDGFKPARGYLGLQAEGHMMEFKNIRVKELGYKLLNKESDWNLNGKTKWLITDEMMKPLPGFSSLSSKEKFKNSVVRFEWRSPKQAVPNFLTLGVGGSQREVSVVFGASTIPAGSVKVDSPLLKKAMKEMTNPKDQWNYMEVRVEGKELAVWLNGTTVQKMTLPKGMGDAAPIALMSEADGVEVKNFRIKELK